MCDALGFPGFPERLAMVLSWFTLTVCISFERGKMRRDHLL